MVDQNLFRLYSRDQTQFSAFDRVSIMLDTIPNQLTVGDFEVAWNQTLSPMDKQFVEVMYPKGVWAAVDLRADVPALKAEIGEHGEDDLYRFDVPKSDFYAVETGGKTDVVMSLFGPNEERRLVTQDDNSGRGLNARIRAQLDPGQYFVRIRHYRPRGKGKYEISLRRVRELKRRPR